MHGAIEDGRQAEIGVDLPAQHPDLPQAHPKRVDVYLFCYLVLQSTLQLAGQALPGISQYTSMCCHRDTIARPSFTHQVLRACEPGVEVCW